MIESGGLDAVAVVTPPDLHYEMTMTALDAGLHVLCEKPLAYNVQQAREMYETAQKKGVVHLTYLTWRWRPHIRYIKELIEEDYIGRCFSLRLSWVAGFWRDNEYSWRVDNKRSSGILSELGTHMIDMARWFAGDIDEVSSHLATFYERQGFVERPQDNANDSAMLTLQFSSGAHANIYVSAVSYVADRGGDFKLELYGEQGTLEAHLTLSGGEINGARSDEKEMKTLSIPDHIWGDLDRTNGAFVNFSGDQYFIDSILQGQPASPSFYDGWKAQEVIGAAKEAHQKRCWVSLV